jgi:hypothetical protein
MRELRVEDIKVLRCVQRARLVSVGLRRVDDMAFEFPVTLLALRVKDGADNEGDVCQNKADDVGVVENFPTAMSDLFGRGFFVTRLEPIESFVEHHHIEIAGEDTGEDGDSEEYPGGCDVAPGNKCAASGEPGQQGDAAGGHNDNVIGQRVKQPISFFRQLLGLLDDLWCVPDIHDVSLDSDSAEKQEKKGVEV